MKISEFKPFVVKTDRKHKHRAFTLVEIMIVVVVVGLLAAVAIPVAIKVRRSVLGSAMDNDARLLANAAQKHWIEFPHEYSLSYSVNAATGGLDNGSELYAYVASISRGTSSSGVIEPQGTFSMSNIGYYSGAVVVYNTEGKRVSGP